MYAGFAAGARFDPPRGLSASLAPHPCRNAGRLSDGEIYMDHPGSRDPDYPSRSYVPAKVRAFIDFLRAAMNSDVEVPT